MQETAVYEVTGYPSKGEHYDEESGVYCYGVFIRDQIVAIGDGADNCSHLARLLDPSKKYSLTIKEVT